MKILNWEKLRGEGREFILISRLQELHGTFPGVPVLGLIGRQEDPEAKKKPLFGGEDIFMLD